MSRPPVVYVNAKIDKATLIDAVEKFADSPHFDHRQWSIFDAEILERLANKIRDGYEGTTCAESGFTVAGHTAGDLYD